MDMANKYLQMEITIKDNTNKENLVDTEDTNGVRVDFTTVNL